MADSRGSHARRVDQLGRACVDSIGSTASEFHRLSQARLSLIGSAQAQAASVPRGSTRGLVGTIGSIS
jgi:hypothetical protein